MSDDPEKAKRRKVLVDPELQIGLSTEMVGWICVYFLVCSLAANVPNFLTLLTSDREEAAHIAALDQVRSFARSVVLPMGVAFVAMAVHGVFMTHRVAGPIVRLKRTMREVAARKLPQPITLRKKDYFKDLADEMNAAVAVLREDSVRRKRMADESLQAVHRLVKALERPSGNPREALNLAHAALDELEALQRHLSATTSEGGDAHPVPLPEADLPAALREDIDELDPQAAPHETAKSA